MSMLKRRDLLWMFAAGLGVPVALSGLAAAYFVLAPRAAEYTRRLPFDSAIWKSRSADAGAEWPTRLRMVDDLLNWRQLHGLTREQVVEFLGPPDRTSKWREWDFVYHLGPERGGLFRIDSEWFVVRFDAGGRVAMYQVVRD